MTNSLKSTMERTVAETEMLTKKTVVASTSTKTQTKASMVLAMLRADGGTTIAEIMAATNWQPHSVRGFLSGTIKKKLGLALTRTTDSDGVQHYGINEQKTMAAGTDSEAAPDRGIVDVSNDRSQTEKMAEPDMEGASQKVHAKRTAGRLIQIPAMAVA